MPQAFSFSSLPDLSPTGCQGATFPGVVKRVPLGIDMASQPKGTAARVVSWNRDSAVAETPCLACDDEMLTELITGAGAVGIDGPFGRPVEFVGAMKPWSHLEWSNKIRDHLRFRETDRRVRAIRHGITS